MKEIEKKISKYIEKLLVVITIKIEKKKKT